MHTKNRPRTTNARTFSHSGRMWVAAPRPLARCGKRCEPSGAGIGADHSSLMHAADMFDGTARRRSVKHSEDGILGPGCTGVGPCRSAHFKDTGRRGFHAADASNGCVCSVKRFYMAR
eukprot:354196-Chlamydomonas_euryale.AAC.13